MKEILLVNESSNSVRVRKLYRDDDEFNLFPRGEYEEWEATEEDIKE